MPRRLRIGYASAYGMAADSGTYAVSGLAALFDLDELPDNTAPYWLESTPLTLGPYSEGEAQTVDLSLYATDDEGDEIEYTRTGGTAPESVTVDQETGELTIPADLEVGTYTVEVEVAEPENVAYGYTEFMKASETQRGTSGYYFNSKGNLRWENLGGDYTDALDVPQGTTAVTTVVVNAENVWRELDVLPFMDRWMNTVSDGMYLKAINTQFASRNHENPSLWPYLRVNVGATEFICPVVADVACYGNDDGGLGSGLDRTCTVRRVSSTDLRGGAIVRFDVSSVVGTPTAAKFVFWVANLAGGTQTLSSFFVRARPPFDARGLPVVLGPASALDNDDFEGIKALPGVIDAWDWPPTWRTDPIGVYLAKTSGDWNEGDGISGNGLTQHPSILADDGTYWLRPGWTPDPTNLTCNIPPYTTHGDYTNEGTIFGPGYPLPGTRSTGLRPLDPIPTTPIGPESMYFRYSMRLNEDWSTVTSDYKFEGGKFPGWDGRYGAPLANGNWDDAGGNGGAQGYGRVFLAGEHNESVNHISGWSARGGFYGGPGRGEIENPMGNTAKLGNYTYLPDNPDGEANFWWADGGAQLVPGREYDVEQYIQMNTIDMSVVDAAGNGVGNFDGVIRTWINGILVHEKTNHRMRHHPCIAIEQVWLVIKNGGTLSPCLPHSMCLGPVVISTNYIGPRKSVSGGLS